MSNILVLGAGKSTTVMVQHLLGVAQRRGWHLTLADRDLELATRKIGGHPCGSAVGLDVEGEGWRTHLQDADLVVSMLPQQLNPPVATAAVGLGVHYASASYVSPSERALHEAAERNDVTLLCEMGLDPGIDHMSAMEKLDELRRSGAKLTAFETFTGGLVAPQSDDNPWHYKLTWNPRNVVAAGNEGVKFKHHGRYKYIPYHKLFSRYEVLSIPGYGLFEGYPNRDSLKYRHHYGLYDVQTLYRGTLRRPGFCTAWDCLVQLGLTDDSYELEHLDGMTWREFVNAYLWWDEDMSVELKLRAYLKLDMNSAAFDKLKWLGLFDRTPIGLQHGTPARVLQHLLEQRWAMAPDDKDMVAMLHKTEFELDGEQGAVQSSMVCIGEDPERTAMALTVGLPLAIAVERILDGTITRRGVVIPTVADVYEPVLAELRHHGIAFDDHQTAG